MKLTRKILASVLVLAMVLMLMPAAFAAGTTHTISWQWIFHTNNDADVVDTTMGNADDLADCSIEISITATQIGD